GGAKRLARDDRLAFRQIRSAAGKFEMTTFRLAQAIALDRPLRKIDINLSHFRQRDLQFLRRTGGTCFCMPKDEPKLVPPHLEISRVHGVPGSTPDIACPAIHPVVQAAWKLKPPVMPSMSSSSPAK